MKEDKKQLLFLVENQEPYAFMLKYKLLKRPQYQILCFKNSEECLESLHINPDAILLDSSMPGMSAIQTLKTLLRKVPKIPVLFIAPGEGLLIEPEFKTVSEQYRKKGILECLPKEEDTTVLADRIVIRVSKIFEKQMLNKQRLRRRFIWSVMFLLLLIMGMVILIR